PITAVAAQKGQFALRDGAVSTFFTDQGLALSLMSGAKKGVAAGLFWNLVGANKVNPRPEGETSARVHSLIGERSQWAVDQNGYSRIAYDQIRPGIDLAVEARPQG